MPIVATLKGDLIALTKAGLFDGMCHGANCFNTMGSGIAKTVKEVFPEAYKADCRTEKGDKSKLGRYTVWSNEGEGPFIFNLYTQYGYGYKGEDLVEYEAMEVGFKKINDSYQHFRLGIPLIGCGLAGGDWDRVNEIINRATPDLSIFVVLYDDKF